MIETSLTGLELYNAAKEAYYNGEPIMTDFEFDELEKSLGLENKSYVGAKHNIKYTVKHPFKMGSLAKVQIKNEHGVIDWLRYLEDINSFINNKHLIITPKFDGCSFEAVYSNQELVSVSSRGDGDYGVDLKNHLQEKLSPILNPIFENDYVLRGEVLINKSKFEQKYSEFTNPRSFVSGILNKNYSDDPEFLDALNDLSIVIYDVKILDNGVWKDHDWTEFVDGEHGLLKDVPEFYKYDVIIDSEYKLRDIYDAFDCYRKECPYALDGIVLKPLDRINDLTVARPSDCVAVKFMPMIEETEVIDIEWNSVKTNEITPVVIYKTIKMDGKKVNRARANNYGWLIKNRVSIGTKLQISLAGDIIPFIYKVTDTTSFSPEKLNLPDHPYEIVDDIHCNLILTEDEKNEKKFLNSAIAIKLPKLGPANAKAIHDWFGSSEDSATLDFFGEESKKCPDNIMLLTEQEILNGLGNGVIASQVAKKYKEFWKSASLKDIIIACCFEDCGGRTAEACASYLTTGEEDFNSCTKSAYEWVYDNNSEQRRYLDKILDFHGVSVDYYKKQAVELSESKYSENRIPVILTGEPNNYSSKAAFLEAHPEYELTGSWKKVQIVFTNSLTSTTGKMKKALANGVEIRVY